LALGMALMSNPDLLLLDEPSLGLQPSFVTRTFEAIQEINRRGVTILLVATGIAAALALSVVSFDTMAMMTFSSLQKQRAGANQPLGLALGGLLVAPAYLTAWILPGIVAVAVDLAEATIIAALSIALFLLSSRLISREKLLP